jgi:hypothetical protein
MGKARFWIFGIPLMRSSPAGDEHERENESQREPEQDRKHSLIGQRDPRVAGSARSNRLKGELPGR